MTEPIKQELPGIDFNSDALPNVVYGSKIEFSHVSAYLAREKIIQFVKQEIC